MKKFAGLVALIAAAERSPAEPQHISVLAAFDPDDVILQVLDSMEGVPDQ